MFVLLSKTLDLLLSPLTWALLCLAAAFAWRRRRPPRAAGAVLGAAGILCVFGCPAVGNLLMRWTEAGARSSYDPGATYDAAILLGGALDAVASQQTGQFELNAAAERATAAYELVRAGRAANLLVSGGLVFPVEGVPPEAEVLGRALVAWGVAPERIVLETRSRNTRENAVESARIVAARGWRKLLLVTSAAHMPRAQACFEAAGLKVDALPVDHRSSRGGPVELLPRSGALSLSTDALRELFGRAVYWARGYTRPQ